EVHARSTPGKTGTVEVSAGRVPLDVARGRVVAHQSHDPVTARAQAGDEGGAVQAGGSCDRDVHRCDTTGGCGGGAQSVASVSSREGRLSRSAQTRTAL